MKEIVEGLDDSRRLDQTWRACWGIRHFSLRIGRWMTLDEQHMEEVFNFWREIALESGQLLNHIQESDFEERLQNLLSKLIQCKVQNLRAICYWELKRVRIFLNFQFCQND